MISKKPTDEDLILIHNKYYPPMVIGRDIYLKFARELLQQFGQPGTGCWDRAIDEPKNVGEQK